jgi:hypothetical protein
MASAGARAETQRAAPRASRVSQAGKLSRDRKAAAAKAPRADTTRQAS